MFNTENKNKLLEITPMVLLAVVDHYKRQSYERVIGILLGNVTETKVVVTNTFAIPFEENDAGFFLDTSYLTNMYELFQKVNSREEIVGWYHSGPHMYKNDLEITKSIGIYCSNPVLAIVNVHLETDDIPVQAYQIDEMKNFKNLNVKIGADENEEVGVEHLLRDIKEGTGSTLNDQFEIIKNSLAAYEDSLTNIINYLDKENGQSERVLKILQDICNAIPRLDGEIEMKEIYNAELVNCVLSMNDLQRSKNNK